jgi:hypothetical protein
MWRQIYLSLTLRIKSVITNYVYPTKKREGAWTLREMGSTWMGGMGEGPSLQAGNKISSWSLAEEGATPS